jgi:two-component system, sensor histidine kinase
MKQFKESTAQKTERLQLLKQRAKAVLDLADKGRVEGVPETLQVLKLLEDLRIYQVELELQNEELRMAQQDAELARKRYQNLFEQMPMPALVVDTNGVVDECNDLANVCLGQQSRNLTHDSRLWKRLNRNDRARMHTALREVTPGQTKILTKVIIAEEGTQTPVFDVCLMGLSIDYKLDRRILLMLVDRTIEVVHEQDQRFYSLLLDSSDSFIYAADKRGQVLLANQTFLNFWGFRREDVLGQKREVFLPLRDAILHNDTDQQVLNSGQVLTLEEQTLVGQGRGAMDLLTRKFPLRDSAGQIYGVGGISTDITILKDQQRKALLSEAVFMGAQEAIIITDATTHIIRVNPAFVRQTGLSPDTVIGCKTNILKSERQNQEYYKAMWHTLNTTGCWSGELENRRSDGTTYVVWSNINAMHDASGRLLHFIGISMDITERKKAQAAQKRSADLLRGAIDTIDEAFVVFDADDRMVLCNDKYRSLYATSSDLMVLGAKFEEIIRTSVARGQYRDAVGREEDWIAERLAVHRNGDTSMVLQLDNGRVLRVIERKMPDGHTVGFRIDITDLVQATEEAQAANLAKSRFLATMSHEIRTPMNGILGIAQLLLIPGLTDKERCHYARTILASGQTLLTLLNDILDLSKIEAGKFQLDSVVFEPESVLHEVCTLFSGSSQAKKLQLDYQWHGMHGQRFQSDPYRLRQMLSNLLGNAIKFTRQGSIHLECTETDRHDDVVMLEFSVKDSGIGIAHNKQDLLFKPFSQTDNSTTREFGGSGLGLSIVRNLSKAMGGTVGVHSEPHKGSRFWFRVPVKCVRPDEECRHVPHITFSQTQVTVDTSELHGRVLVAEDNPVNCMVIESLLEKLGMTVTTVHDGQEAVNAITSVGSDGQPDLILMDLQMPVMDGYVAAQRIRQWESDHNMARLPILALTADAFDEDRRRCLAVGMDDFLTKPISVDVLKLALARWLQGDVFQTDVDKPILSQRDS